MILNNIKKLQNNHGFTIVELLVVIVVIGILASITVVSYTGITQRANTSKAMSNAKSAQTVAEAYATENAYYPSTLAIFNTGANSAKLPSGVSVIAVGSLSGQTSNNKLVMVTWECNTASCANPTGGRITYWDFGTNLASTNVFYLGQAKSGDTFYAAS